MYVANILHNGTNIALYSFVYRHIFCSYCSDENIVAHAFYLVSSLYIWLVTSSFFLHIPITVDFLYNDRCRVDKNDLKYLFFE